MKKSHIRETLNLSTNAESSTDPVYFFSGQTFFGGGPKLFLERVQNIFLEGPYFFLLLSVKNFFKYFFEGGQKTFFW